MTYFSDMRDAAIQEVVPSHLIDILNQRNLCEAADKWVKDNKCTLDIISVDIADLVHAELDTILDTEIRGVDFSKILTLLQEIEYQYYVDQDILNKLTPLAKCDLMGYLKLVAYNKPTDELVKS